MRLDSISSRLRRVSAFAVLGVGLTALALSLSQCQMVGERLTGVDLTAAKPSQCMNKCAKVYVEAKKLEIDHHKELAKACAGDTVCLALEDARFAQALELLKANQTACQSGCHHQGSGTGY